MELVDKVPGNDDDLKVNVVYKHDNIDYVIEEEVDGLHRRIIDIHVTPICIHRIVAPEKLSRPEMMDIWGTFFDKKYDKTEPINVLCLFLDDDGKVNKQVRGTVFPYHGMAKFTVKAKSRKEYTAVVDCKVDQGPLIEAMLKCKRATTDMLTEDDFEGLVSWE